MRICVKAKPNAKIESVKKIDDENFIVAVKEPPIQGRANVAIIKALADYFGVSVADVKIVAGFISRNKVIEIKKER